MARSRTTDPALVAEKEARKRVEQEKKFYGGLASYVLIIAMLAAINLLTSPGYLWFVWPMLGWGVGIVSHTAKVFGLPGLGRNWEERRLQTLMGAEPSDARLRQLLDETLDERAIPAGQPQTVTQLQRRIEHLEAIVTSRDWDETATFADDRLDVDSRTPVRDARSAPLADALLDDADETPAEQAARLARRVR